MKKFDLELAKQGHPICTREGKKAKLLTILSGDRTRPLVVKCNDHAYVYFLNGKYYSGGGNSEKDLFLDDSDLRWMMKPGNLIQTKNGTVYYLITNSCGLRKTAYVTLRLDNNLNDLDYDDFSIMTIYHNPKITTLDRLLDIEDWDVLWTRSEVELTMQEIADKFEIPVGQLRIKE